MLKKTRSCACPYPLQNSKSDAQRLPGRQSFPSYLFSAADRLTLGCVPTASPEFLSYSLFRGLYQEPGLKALDGLMAARQLPSAHYRKIDPHSKVSLSYGRSRTAGDSAGRSLTQRLASPARPYHSRTAPSAPFALSRLQSVALFLQSARRKNRSGKYSLGTAASARAHAFLRSHKCARVSRAERTRNLVGCFSLAPEAGAKIRGKRIWLVDDVATTGATLENAALALKVAGAKKVYGIVVAR